MRVVFMGTPQFAVPTLEALARSCEIVGVYTQPDRPRGRGLEMVASPVKRVALDRKLPVFQPERLTAPGEFDRLSRLRPEAIVVAAYGQLLKKEVLELPPLGCINIHSSLLPRWRGAAPIQCALLAGDEETGVTTMMMAEKLDAGDILLQARTAIRAEDTAGTLHDRLAGLGAELILPSLQGLAEGSLKPRPQNREEVTYARKLTKEMETLDPARSAEELDRQVRALDPWPGTSVQVRGLGRLKVKRAVLRRDLSAPAGTIMERNGMVLLGTAAGSLELIRVQWEGKKELDVGAFLNGLRGRGQRLPLELESEAK